MITFDFTRISAVCDGLTVGSDYNFEKLPFEQETVTGRNGTILAIRTVPYDNKKYLIQMTCP